MERGAAYSVNHVHAGIQSTENNCPLDCPASLIPVYSKDTGRAMTDRAYPYVSSGIQQADCSEDLTILSETEHEIYDL
jgi:hypothetical protein